MYVTYTSLPESKKNTTVLWLCRWGFFFFGIANMSLFLEMKLHEYSVPGGQALAYVPVM